MKTTLKHYEQKMPSSDLFRKLLEAQIELQKYRGEHSYDQFNNLHDLIQRIDGFLEYLLQEGANE